MTKYLMIMFLGFQLVSAQQHQKDQRSLPIYDHISSEIKEAHLKTAFISCILSSFISIIVVYYFAKRNPHDIIIRPVDSAGNAFNFSMKFID